jgi:uncharacterized protein YkwD
MGLSITALLAACSGGGGDGDDDGGDDDDGGSIGAIGLALYVLAGGTSVPDIDDLFEDGDLDPGEIFIVPKDPLDAGALYQVDLTADAGGVSYAATWTFTTAVAAPAPATASVIDEVNNFRTQAGGMPSLSANAAMAQAAILHSGYQCEKDTITHNETDSGATFFVHTNFFSRISIANGGTAISNTWPGGSDVVYEIIASNDGTDAVLGLWNTVYHRLPMMRRHTTLMGEGDRGEAAVHVVNVPPVIVAIDDPDFQTIELAGDSSIAQTTAFWPADGQIGVATSFASNTESPDPVDSGNANGTPDDNLVGVPIHFVAPTTADFTAIVVTVTKL